MTKTEDDIPETNDVQAEPGSFLAALIEDGFVPARVERSLRPGVDGERLVATSRDEASTSSRTEDGARAEPGSFMAALNEDGFVPARLERSSMPQVAAAKPVGER